MLNQCAGAVKVWRVERKTKDFKDTFCRLAGEEASRQETRSFFAPA